jgi:uncharacterized OB-fold protein
MSKTTLESVATEGIPIRDNLFIIDAEGRSNLIVSHCKECGQKFYPLVPMCPSCIKEDTVDTLEIRGRGRIVSFTKVLRGLPGYDSPYVLACIELDEGPSVIAQLQDYKEIELRINMPVELVIGKIKQEKDGSIIVGPKFKPLSTRKQE